MTTKSRTFSLLKSASPTPVRSGRAEATNDSVALNADPIVEAMEEATAAIPKLFSPAEVAASLGVTERTLERWRIIGEGPRYIKLTRSTVRYTMQDIANFISTRFKANTAQ